MLFSRANTLNTMTLKIAQKCHRTLSILITTLTSQLTTVFCIQYILGWLIPSKKTLKASSEAASLGVKLLHSVSHCPTYKWTPISLMSPTQLRSSSNLFGVEGFIDMGKYFFFFNRYCASDVLYIHTLCFRSCSLLLSCWVSVCHCSCKQIPVHRCYFPFEHGLSFIYGHQGKVSPKI